MAQLIQRVIAPPASDEELIATAIKERNIGMIKEVRNLAAAKPEQRIPLIEILVHQGWIGPRDETALETLWGSFGPSVLDVASKNPDLWTLSLKGGAELYKLKAVQPLAENFLTDVRFIAGKYLVDNEKYCVEELRKLGVTEEGGAAAPSESEQADRAAELSVALRIAKEARDVQTSLRGVIVGLERRLFLLTNRTLYWTVLFDPNREPAPDDANPPQDRIEKARASGVSEQSLTRTPWKDVKAQWDVLDAILQGLSIAYPVVGISLMSTPQRETNTMLGPVPSAPGPLPGADDDPKAARSAIVSMLTTTRDNIRGTKPKLAGKLAYELSPIHNQLFGGAKGSTNTDWKDPVRQAVAKEVLELRANIEFWKSMGLATLAAAAFVLAEFATAGMASVALAGFGVGLGAGQAIVAWEKALEMRSAEKATTGSGTELLASGQASMATFEAALATVLVFADAFAAAKPIGRAVLGAVDRAALGAGAKAATRITEELASLGGKAPDRALVERAVTELGAENVVAKTGRSASELLGIVGEESPIAGRLKALAAIPAELTKLTPPELATRAANIAAEVAADRQTGEALATLAVERFGPKRVLDMNGGWKKLSLALGNESAAGRSIMAWRDGLIGDIEGFVKTLPGGVDEAGKAAVKRTGSQGKFTNDFDVSLLGAHASQNRNAVRSFVAGRVGTTPDRLGDTLLADFFTDPRRLHLYDQLDPGLRAEIGTRAEKVAESTIMAKTLHDAEAAGNKELAEQIRGQMKALGIEEVKFTPLSEGDRAALYTKIDDYHQQLEQAIASGDKAVQKSLVEKIGDTQGLINATEGGGYFSGGATRQIVTLAEGLLKGGTKPLDAQVYTALLDQLPKLNAEASALLKTGVVASEEAVGAIKGVAKYGSRFRQLLTKLEVKVADEGAWNSLADRLGTLLHQAKGETDVTLLARLQSDAEGVEKEVGGLLAEFRAASQDALLQLSRQAAMGGQRVDLNAIQFLVLATAKLTRASNAIRESLRAIGAQIAEVALAAQTLSAPQQSQSGPVSAPSGGTAGPPGRQGAKPR